MASKRRLRRKREAYLEKKCGEKVQYKTAFLAKRAMLEVIYKGKSNRPFTMRVYPCKDHFHFGHTNILNFER